MPISTVLPERLNWKTAAVFVLLSAIYFADALLRASHKAFWFDELVTVYLCRLPTFHATWTAVLQGSDLNPPLFYLVTRASEHLLGEGPVATRIPSLLGFWVFSICLYAVAARRMGRVRGLIAALAPVFTLAYSYAYEARASAVVLAWCGLMLVCWQRTRESSSSRGWQLVGWLLGFALSFTAALLTHVYAALLCVPFLLVELGHLIAKRSVRRDVCAALVAPLALVAPMYLQLSRHYGDLRVGRLVLFNPFVAVQNHLMGLYAPALALLLLSLAVLAFRAGHGYPETPRPRLLSQDELWLAFAFVSLPIIVVFAVLPTHIPSANRYLLYTTAGYALLLAQAFSYRQRTPRVAQAVAAIMVLAFAAQLTSTLATSRHFKPTASAAGVALLANSSGSSHGQLDILVTAELTFLPLYYYATPELRERMVFGSRDGTEFMPAWYRNLAKWADIDLRTITFAEFLATHHEFLLYAAKNSYQPGRCVDCLQPFLAAGYTVRSVDEDADTIVERLSR
jgi:4-amino-4-deoxy-L-arabinose transferase-like glycosyltransferase